MWRFIDGESRISFISGCTFYKLDVVIKYGESKGYVRSMFIVKRKFVEKSEVANILMIINRNNTEKLSRMIRLCYVLVMYDRFIIDFIWLCNLDERKGIELGSTYRIRDLVVEFIKCIVDVEFKKVFTEFVELILIM